MKPSYYPSNPTAPWRVMVPKKWSPTGKRKAEYLKSLEEAKKFCQLVRRHGDHYPEYLDNGKPKGCAPVMTQYQEDQWKSAARHCATRLGDISVLYQAVDYWLTTRTNIKPATVEQAIAEFHKARQDDPKITSERTRQTYRSELKKLARQFPSEQLCAIDKAKIQELRREVKSSRTVYKTVKAFFGWAADNNYVKESPMKNEKPWSDWGINNQHYEVEEFERMLRICAGLDPIPGLGLTRRYEDLLPWLILGGFGGLRTREISRLDKTDDALRWSDLHFDAKIPQIEIRAAATKTRQRRIVSKPYAIDAIQAWLPLVASRNEFICSLSQNSLTALKKEFKEATGLDFAENGLRNSFGTYALCYDGKEGAGSVSLQMGNSESTLLRHYVGERFAEGTGQAWFTLRPSTMFTSHPVETNEEAAA